MSWQKYSIQFILGLPLALPIVSYAINIGDTYIQSQQNQPLQASINVSDIDPKTFSVQLSSPTIYQQLGLTQEDGLAVRFEPTSGNGGRIVLTSQRPIAAPFADVVLDVANKGEFRVLPKTLLMPLNETQRIVTQPTSQLAAVAAKHVTIGADSRVKLPIIGQPLVVIHAEPPPMDLPSALPKQGLIQGAPIMVSSVSASPTLVPTDSLKVASQVNNQAINQTPFHNNLVINETRRYYVVGSVKPVEVTPAIVTANANMPVFIPEGIKSEADAANLAKTREAQVTYVIQRNDNLWTIANRIAQQQHRDVNQVMQAIVATNPQAFINGDPSQMVANSKLVLPTYATTPSKTAINAVTRATKPAVRSTKAPLSTRKTPKATKATHNPLVNAARRRSEMTITAPSQRHGVAQGGTQSASNQANTPVSVEQAQKLQQKRQLIAKKSRSITELDKTLSSTEQGLKVQNARLAQLEKRLERLTNP